MRPKKVNCRRLIGRIWRSTHLLKETASVLDLVILQSSLNHTHPQPRRVARVGAAPRNRSAAWKHIGRQASIELDDSTALCSMQSREEMLIAEWQLLHVREGGEACDHRV